MSEQQHETRSGLPAFETAGVTFECWVAGSGGAARYVWRSRCGRCVVADAGYDDDRVMMGGEMVTRKAKLWGARADGRVIGTRYRSLGLAMAAAAAEAAQRSAA